MQTPVRQSLRLSWKGSEITLSYLHRPAGADTLLLLHGLQSTSELFLPLFHSPSYSSYSLLAPDFGGFGGSTVPDGFSYDLADQAALMAQLLHAVKAPRVSVVGHSLGGMVGTILVDTHPEVQKLVSLEGNLVEGDCGESLKVSNQSLADFQATYAGKGTTAAAFHQTSRSIVEWSRSNRLLEIFESSAQPKLLVLGGNSNFASRPQSKSISTVVIPGAGHFLLRDQPELTLQAMIRFLN